MCIINPRFFESYGILQVFRKIQEKLSIAKNLLLQYLCIFCILSWGEFEQFVNAIILWHELMQWFSNLSMKYPQHCTFCMSLSLTHTLQVLQSNELMSWIRSDMRETYIMCRAGVLQDRFENHWTNIMVYNDMKSWTASWLRETNNFRSSVHCWNKSWASNVEYSCKPKDSSVCDEPALLSVGCTERVFSRSFATFIAHSTITEGIYLLNV